MDEHLRINLPMEALAAFCQRWKIRRLEAFGSVVREDFGPSSDIDLIATFSDESDWSLLDHAQMELELRDLLGREVDLLTRRAIETSRNPLRREEILRSTRVVFDAA